MSDYERIARVIRYLDEHHTEQPSLDALARLTGLSAFHFHRLFTAWAGVTPKEFVQCLTLTHVRELLRRGESVLNAAVNAGLSGPGRLHDLCLSLEAASPGELKHGGEGWTITVGATETPFGRCVMGEGPRGICYLAFTDLRNNDAALNAVHEAWPAAKLRRDDAAATRVAEAIFRRAPSSNSRPPLRAFVRGTPFQVRVWRALLDVPTGGLTSYGQLARAIGQPAAARAVGSAVGSNPLAYLIPCHRVIRETGVVGQYRWGEARKRAMIAWESAPGPTEKASRPRKNGSPEGRDQGICCRSR